MRRIMTATAVVALLAAGPAFAQQAQQGPQAGQAGPGQAGTAFGYNGPQAVSRNLQQIESELGNAEQSIRQQNYKQANQSLQQAYLLLEQSAATNTFGPATPLLINLQQQIYTAHQAFQQNPTQAAGMIARVRNELQQFGRSPQTYVNGPAGTPGPAGGNAAAAQNAPAQGGNGGNQLTPQNAAKGQ